MISSHFHNLFPLAKKKQICLLWSLSVHSLVCVYIWTVVHCFSCSAVSIIRQFMQLCSVFIDYQLVEISSNWRPLTGTPRSYVYMGPVTLMDMLQKAGVISILFTWDCTLIRVIWNKFAWSSSKQIKNCQTCCFEDQFQKLRSHLNLRLIISTSDQNISGQEYSSDLKAWKGNVLKFPLFA